MLSRLFRAARRPPIRSGKPLWDRPDVPQNVRDVNRRFISQEHIFLNTPNNAYLNQFIFNDPSLFYDDPEIRKEIKYLWAKIALFVTFMFSIGYCAQINHYEHWRVHSDQLQAKRVFQKRLAERSRIKAIENNFLGIRILPEMGKQTYQDDLDHINYNMQPILKEQQIYHKIAGETKNSILKLIQEAEEHARHQMAGEGHGQTHGHHGH